MASLQLDRNLQNASFESWKIGSNFIRSRSVINLPASIYAGASDAVDYLHTRASVLRNHLVESQGRLFLATRADQDALLLYEVVRYNPSNADVAGLDLVETAGTVVATACCRDTSMVSTKPIRHVRNDSIQTNNSDDHVLRNRSNGLCTSRQHSGPCCLLL